MSTHSKNLFHNITISVSISILSEAAASGGIFGCAYREDEWSGAQMIGQDVLTLIVAAALLFFTVFFVRSLEIQDGG
jgi:hypothetical protein